MEHSPSAVIQSYLIIRLIEVTNKTLSLNAIVYTSDIYNSLKVTHAMILAGAVTVRH